MATSFRDWPWPLQALLYVGLAIVLVLAGFYVPGLPLQSTCVRSWRTPRAELKPLEADVANLRVYKQRRAELQTEMDALQKQLATLQTIVPEDKQTDQFILMVQSAAVSSGVSIRSLTASPIAHQALLFRDAVRDGSGRSVLLGSGFLRALGRLSRIINVGDLKLTSLAGPSQHVGQVPSGRRDVGDRVPSRSRLSSRTRRRQAQLPLLHRRRKSKATTMKLANISANLLAVLVLALPLAISVCGAGSSSRERSGNESQRPRIREADAPRESSGWQSRLPRRRIRKHRLRCLRHAAELRARRHENGDGRQARSVRAADQR